jgi:hypothetical protein
MTEQPTAYASDEKALRQALYDAAIALQVQHRLLAKGRLQV